RAPVRGTRFGPGTEAWAGNRSPGEGRRCAASWWLRRGGRGRGGLARSGGAGGGELHGGQLVDLGGELGEGRLEARQAGGAGAALLVVIHDVLDGVLGVGLEVLGPVEDVVHEVLGVIDDVFDEPGEGVLALRHVRLLSPAGRPCARLPLCLRIA